MTHPHERDRRECREILRALRDDVNQQDAATSDEQANEDRIAVLARWKD